MTRPADAPKSYIIRGVNERLWQQFKMKAAGEGVKGASLKDLIERFIRDYVTGRNVKGNE